MRVTHFHNPYGMLLHVHVNAGIYQKILSGKIVFPKFFDKNGKVLVKKLLTADLGKRYGNLKNGVEDIKKAKWFQGLDWDQLLRREIAAPYKPSVKSATDTSESFFFCFLQQHSIVYLFLYRSTLLFFNKFVDYHLYQ